MWKIIVSVLILASIMLIGCNADTVVADLDLKGSWSVYDATRNGKVTKTLKGGIFMFTSDTSFTTNIFGEESLFTFEKNRSLIKTTSGEPALRLSLASPHIDSVVLRGKIKYFDMEFFLVRDSIQ